MLTYFIKITYNMQFQKGVKIVYLITYQKSNGDVFCRVRNTLPSCKIGSETSMGWKLLDIKYRFKNNYYTLPECLKLKKKQYKKIHLIQNIKNLIFKSNILLFILILILLLK